MTRNYPTRLANLFHTHSGDLFGFEGHHRVEIVHVLNRFQTAYRAALGVAYGAGLRVSEVAHLKANDIDSRRMLIRIEEGKRLQRRCPVVEHLRCLHEPGARWPDSSVATQLSGRFSAT